MSKNKTLFVGLGHMGYPMASLLADEFNILVNDISKDAMDQVERSTKARALRTLDDLSEIDTVILMLPTSSHVEDLLLDQGLLQRLEAGSLVIDMGSSRPESTMRLAKFADELEIDYVDAPVSGGVSKAETGELSILVGAAEAAEERARPLLEVLGSTLVHVGGPGSGHAAKAINNLVSATNMAVVAEALIRGRAVGIRPERLIAVLNASTGMSQASQVKYPRHMLTEEYASNFAYDLMLKDIGIALEMTGKNASTPLTDLSAQVLADGRKYLGETPDHTEIGRVYEYLAQASIMNGEENDESS
jgi:3-hydroxyisobutyrate dehydrogenase